MAERAMKEPGPDHPITVEPAAGRVRVLVAGEVLADSQGALVLREADYPPVFYIPRGDVAMERLEPSAHTTWCPYKGEAAYFGIRTDGRVVENAVWTYEPAFPAVGVISGHLAFYAAKVDAIEAGPLAAGEAGQADVAAGEARPG